MSRTADSVRRFLVTGLDEHLTRFHLMVCWRLNGIERRGQTVAYTCMAEDADFALQAATQAGVTLQEIEITPDGRETYPVLLTGPHGLQYVGKPHPVSVGDQKVH